MEKLTMNDLELIHDIFTHGGRFEIVSLNKPSVDKAGHYGVYSEGKEGKEHEGNRRTEKGSRKV